MIVSNVEWDSLPRGEPEVADDGRRAYVPHGEIVCWARESVAHGGFEADHQLTWQSRDGQDLLCVIPVRDPAKTNSNQAKPCVGLRASHRGRIAFRWYHGLVQPDGGGVCVMRCEEPSKQTSILNIKNALERCVDVLAVKKGDYVREMQQLKLMKFTEARWHALMTDRMRRHKEKDRVSLMKMGVVDRLIRETEAKTAWDVLLCFCRASGTSVGGVHRLDQLWTFYEPFAQQFRGES